MADRMKEYNRGRDQGLDMAYRILKDEGETKAAAIIQGEIKKRGKMPVKIAATSKEVAKAIDPIKKCMYETFMCMALMVLHDKFGFGKKRCLDFIGRWNYKSSCMEDELVSWADMIQAVKEDMGIDLPTEHMRMEKLI